MKVHSLKYPNVSVKVDDKYYTFKDGWLDLPDGIALRITQMSSDYVPEYQQTTTAMPKFNPNSWQPNYRKLIWDGPVGYNNGYGKASMMFMEGLDEIGVDLYPINSRWAGSIDDFVGDKLNKLLTKNTNDLDCYVVKFFPASEFPRAYGARRIGYTMLEASRIPDSWVKLCNEMERIIVPCYHQKEAFINSGVKVDIEIVPLGLRADLFPLIDRKSDGLYYFGSHGTLTYRKGTDLLVKAFHEGLPKANYPDARLYIKTLTVGGIGVQWFASNELLKNDDRIDICYESFSPDQLIHDFFEKIDCYVFPTRGEGFGLPPAEAISTGLPTICTTYSGTGDFINDKTGYPVGYKMVDVPNKGFGGYSVELQADGQQWADPNLDEIIEHMRYCYNNREKAKQRGIEGSKIIKKNYDYKVCAKQLVNYLDRKF